MTRSLLKMAQERRRAAGEVAHFAVYDIAQTLGGFGVGALLAVLGLGGAAPLLGLTAASLACLAFAFPAELKAARAGRFDKGALRRYATYGLPVSLSLIMGLALASTDRFVLAAYLNPAAVGAYHAGYSLSSRTLDVIFIWLGMAGGPAAVAALERGGRAALEKVARNQAELMALIALPAAAGLALVAQPLAQVMVGPDLREAAARVTPWIAVGGLMSGAATYYFHTAFTLSKRTARLFRGHRPARAGQPGPGAVVDPQARPGRRHVGDHRQLRPEPGGGGRAGPAGDAAADPVGGAGPLRAGLRSDGGRRAARAHLGRRGRASGESPRRARSPTP